MNYGENDDFVLGVPITEDADNKGGLGKLISILKAPFTRSAAGRKSIPKGPMPRASDLVANKPYDVKSFGAGSVALPDDFVPSNHKARMDGPLPDDLTLLQIWTFDKK